MAAPDYSALSLDVFLSSFLFEILALIHQRLVKRCAKGRIPKVIQLTISRIIITVLNYASICPLIFMYVSMPASGGKVETS